MTFIAPSATELGLLAKTFGLKLADDDIAAIVELSKGLKPAYDRIDELVEDIPCRDIQGDQVVLRRHRSILTMPGPG
jgi:hypothetical protein